MEPLYTSSGALIFPSKIESLGLPLAKAQRFGLPSLAPEVDFVCDVVCPMETFDPDSPVSIARAVRRFLGNPERTVAVLATKEFVKEVFG